jgi:hypothetical protein
MKKNYIREKKKNSRGKKMKILIQSKEKNKKNSNFFKSIFETQKQTCFNKKFQPNLKCKKLSSPKF